MKEFKIVLVIISLSVSSAFGQVLPSFFIQDTTRIFVNSGINHVYLGNINDGDGGTENLLFSYESSDTSIISVKGIGYEEDNHVGILELKEKTITGQTYIRVQLNDDDGSYKDSTLVIVENYNYPGISYQIHDAVFWQEVIPLNGSSSFDTIILSGQGPWSDINWDNIDLLVSDDCSGSLCTGDDFFTVLYKGILIPPINGDYTFYMECQDDMSLWLSSDENYANASCIIYKGSNNVGTDVGSLQWKSETQTLKGGQPYAIYGTQWVVHEKRGGILMEGPGITKDFIDGQLLMPIYDQIKPSVVDNIETIARSTNKVIIKWDPATDNLKISGYNIYLNGILYDSLVTNTSSFEIEDLLPGTDYNIIITAVDQLNNESLASNVHKESTYIQESEPPTPPTSLEIPVKTGVSAKLKWVGATDIGSAVIGYNLYINDQLYNTNDYLYTDSIIIYNLMPTTAYSITLEAIDASYNISGLSQVFTFITGAFDPYGPNLGEKIGRINIELKNIATSEGIGINGPYQGGTIINNSDINNLVRDLNPGTIRWGGIPANLTSLAGSTGLNKSITYGQMLNLANDIGCKFSLVVGVNDGIDYRTNLNTFDNLLEYLAGDETTTWGAIRASEGFTEPLLQNSNGILIEFGNEVWGKDDHYAPIGNDYNTYGKWCRDAAAVIKASEYYDSSKITLVYSGRNPQPSDSYGLHEILLNGDNGDVECLSISGYLGGNLNYDPEVPAGDSELEYYKYRINHMYDNIKGLKETMRTVFSLTNEIKPYYFYESNLSTPEYNGRLGQAVVITDYMVESMKIGSIVPTIYQLTGGEWKIISQGDDDFKKLPLYYIAQHFNDYGKGDILMTNLETQEYITDGAGHKIGLDPIGVHAFSSGEDYMIILTGRDFENDFTVQLNLPNGFNTSTTAKKYTITGNSYSTLDAIVDTLDIDFKDSMLINVPKYSMVFITFTGDTQNFERFPLGSFKEILVDSISIFPIADSNITSDKQKIYFDAKVFPQDAIINEIEWEIHDVVPVNMTYTNGASTLTGYYYLQGSGDCDGDGNITLRAKSKRNPSVFDDISVNVSDQDCAADLISIGISNENYLFYPNPVSGVLRVNNSSRDLVRIQIFDFNGKKIIDYPIYGISPEINIESLDHGIYLIQVFSEAERFSGKLIVK